MKTSAATLALKAPARASAAECASQSAPAARKLGAQLPLWRGVLGVLIHGPMP